MSDKAPVRHAFKQVPQPALLEKLKRALTGIEVEFRETSTDIDLHVAPSNLLRTVKELNERKELGFDFLRNVSGVDYVDDGLAAVYNFYSFKQGYAVQVTAATPLGNPVVPSLCSIFAAADWHEREAAEMVGLVFEGHPNPKNLLLEEDLRIHPLLKAHPLQKVEILQGIEETDAGFKF
jgi:NADH-quinone oxidoreductase subunit C